MKTSQIVYNVTIIGLVLFGYWATRSLWCGVPLIFIRAPKWTN